MLVPFLFWAGVTSANGQAEPLSDAPPATIDTAEAQNWIELIATAYPFLVVNVVLDGKTIPAMLDTGLSNTIIDLQVARSLGMDVRPYGKLESFGGAVDLYATDFNSFEIAGWRQRRGTIGVVDLSHIRAKARNAFSVMIGIDLLAHTALQVDWDHDRIRLLPGGTTLAGRGVPLRISAPTNHLATGLSVNNHAFDPVAVDTGSDGAVAVQKSLLPQLSVPANHLTSRLTSVAGGMITSDYFRAQTVQFGDLRFEKLPTEVDELVVPGSRQFQARIGMEFLQRFNFLMDPRAGRMVMTPRVTPIPPTQISTSGVQGDYKPDGLNIVHVMRGSPAEKAGLKSGDRICMVDGEKVDASWENSGQREWSMGRPGRRVILSLCNGDSKTLTLSEFY
ncbi:MAG: aspartyl protease family protein [Phyllobacterium sp.]